ncbi:hypothetical protein RhiirA1_465036 [Rhizophagus irregularis]|uniref:Uncharacterized protein n=1 Tax=Rhizophagus irregularis TaxID=588596 RepID=A0A2N0RGT3_9GLOM|nr:hypothetical protein RhiirA1_465036 [Rhizophagus irregularis]
MPIEAISLRSFQKNVQKIPSPNEYSFSNITFSPHPAHTIVATVENYNPIPATLEWTLSLRKLPERYEPFVPRSPIYDAHQNYLPPGSAEWSGAVHRFYALRDIEPGSDADYRRLRLSQDHGTSLKHIQRRLDTTTYLTTVQTRYHRYMTHATGNCSDKAYNHELRCYTQYINSLPKDYMIPHLEDIAYNDTSDDTKELEVHTKKWDSFINFNDHHLYKDQLKCDGQDDFFGLLPRGWASSLA